MTKPTHLRWLKDKNLSFGWTSPVLMMFSWRISVVMGDKRSALLKGSHICWPVNHADLGCHDSRHHLRHPDSTGQIFFAYLGLNAFLSG